MSPSSPRHHVYLVPGFFGFSNLGELTYFAHVADYLRGALLRLGVTPVIHTVHTYPTASISRRAARLLEQIAAPPVARAEHARAAVLARRRRGRRHRQLLPGRRRRGPGHRRRGGRSGRRRAHPPRGPLERRARHPPARHARGQLADERGGGALRAARAHRGHRLHAAPRHAHRPFFTSLLGQRLLGLVSLSTMYVLKLGRVPISVLLRLGGMLARVDNLVGINSALLDQLFGQLLEDFSRERREAIAQFFHSMGEDQSLMLQLAPEGMELFNASTQPREEVRYGSVVTRARPPGVGSTLAVGLDPAAHATHTLYVALYQLAGLMPPERLPVLTEQQAAALHAAYGQAVSARDSDGVVPTRSQVRGDLIYAARADHLDSIGHFHGPDHLPPHIDWLATGTGFSRSDFESLWSAVARYIVGA